MRRKVRNTLLIPALFVIVVIAAIFIYNRYHAKPVSKVTTQATTLQQEAHHTYALNILSGISYKPEVQQDLTFTIQDENGTRLKQFDTVNESLIHVVVIRKDFTDFQLVTPSFDALKGTFTLKNITFSTAGSYRVFALFTATNAAKDDLGTKIPLSPYSDVNVGSGSTAILPPVAEQLSSSANGFDTTLSVLGGDNPGIPIANAGMPLSLGVTIDKNSAPYKSLQPYLGTLAYMVAFNPDLTITPVTQISDASSLQVGLVSFGAIFPTKGLYPVFVQAKS